MYLCFYLPIVSYFKYIFITLFGIHAAMKAMWDHMEDLSINEEKAQIYLEQVTADHPTESHHKMGDVDTSQEVEMKYSPSSWMFLSCTVTSNRCLISFFPSQSGQVCSAIIFRYHS